MTTFGRALEMRVRLGRLIREHDARQEPINIPLTDPVDGPIVVEGHASTCDVDLEHVRVHPWAFGFPLMLREMPPLLFKHQPDQVAGKIESLSYDEGGQLLVRATVTHEQAKRCGAFSVAAKVVDYEMRDADGPNFFAVIKQAEITEVSMTSTPCNPKALVRSRCRPSAAAQFYPLMQERVGRLIQLVALMKEQAHAREQHSR